jgi:hypothetical protein
MRRHGFLSCRHRDGVFAATRRLRLRVSGNIHEACGRDLPRNGAIVVYAVLDDRALLARKQAKVQASSATPIAADGNLSGGEPPFSVFPNSLASVTLTLTCYLDPAAAAGPADRGTSSTTSKLVAPPGLFP